MSTDTVIETLRQEIADLKAELEFGVQRLRLQPGDVVVLNVPGPISDKIADRIKEHMGAVIGAGHKVVVLDGGMSLQVLAPEAVEQAA